jgi:P4 family phage/plasmid primase-like protien
MLALRARTIAGRGESPRHKFGWPVSGDLEGDLPLDHFMAEHDLLAIDWDAAVFWNVDLAKTAALLKVHGADAMVLLAFPTLSLDVFDNMSARVPRSEKRSSDHLTHAIGHVVRSVDGFQGRPWRVYDPHTGVWFTEGQWFAGHEGQTTQSLIDDAITGFEQALHRAAELLGIALDFVLPEPAETDENAERITAARNARLKHIREVVAYARSLSRGRDRTLKAALRDRLAVDQEWWDANPRHLLVRDGVIDLEQVLRTGEVEVGPFGPLLAATAAIDVRLSDAPPADASTFVHGVAKVLPDADVRAYLQKRFGAALLGRPSIAGKSLVWQWGPGDTGKSTLQEVIAGHRGVLAPYSVAASSRVITRRGADRDEGGLFIARARGKRFAIISEIPEGELLDQEVVKGLTGGDTVTGAMKYRNPVEYPFTATVFVATNHPPSLPPGDTALLGRVHVVPFRHRLWIRSKNPTEWVAADESHRADEDWAAKVLDDPRERAAILRWVLDGLAAFGRDGLGELPAEMRATKDSFAEEADPIYGAAMALLSKDGNTDGWLRILTDDEWAHEDLRDGDGVTRERVEQLIAEWLRRRGHVTAFGDVKPKAIRAVVTIINEHGGAMKKARVPATGATVSMFTRVREITAEPEHATAEPAATAEDY